MEFSDRVNFINSSVNTGNTQQIRGAKDLQIWLPIPFLPKMWKSKPSESPACFKPYGRKYSGVRCLTIFKMPFKK